MPRPSTVCSSASANRSGVAARGSLHGEPQVGLLDRALLNDDLLLGQAVLRRRGRGGGCGAEAVEAALCGFDDPRVRHGAGDREHGVLRAVAAIDVGDEVVAGQRLDGLDRAGDGPADRLVAVDGAHHQLGGTGGGGVVAATDLLLDDGALAVDLPGVEQGVLDHVGQHLDARPGALEGHVVPVAGQFAGGVGVERAAGALDRLADLGGGGACRGALEEQVLQVVGDAVGAAVFVARADADEEGDAGALGRGDGRGDDAQAVGQRADLRLDRLGRRHPCAPPLALRGASIVLGSAYGRRVPPANGGGGVLLTAHTSVVAWSQQ